MLNGLYAAAACCYAAGILVLWAGLLRLAKFTPVRKDCPTVTVVIPARNEEKNINACLDALVKQRYPSSRYEIIVVDDQSTDKTPDIIKNYAEKFKNIHYLQLLDPGHRSPKKAAIDKAVQRSKSELIFTTDADCTVPIEWLSTMTAYFDDHVAAAASWLLVSPGQQWYQQVEALDSCSFVLVGAAAFGLNRPVLANGANFAYRRSAFINSGGFSGNDEFASGDDDLLLQKMCKHSGCCVFVNDIQAAVSTPANSRVSDFLKQRLRWASKTRAYSLPLQLLEIAVYLFICMLVTGPFVVICTLLKIRTFLLVLSVKCLLDYFFIRYGCALVNKKPKIIFFCIAQILQNAYIAVVGFWGAVGQYEWKGRTYRQGKIQKKD